MDTRQTPTRCTQIAVIILALLLAVGQAMSFSLPALAVYAERRHGCRPRVALALGGGGTRGAAHIGVLRVFEQEGIPVDCITGTSIGSIIGGLYAAGMPLPQIQELIENKSILHAYMVIPIALRAALLPFTTIPRLFGIHPYVGLFGSKSFARYINNVLPPGRRNIENCRIPFKAIATDMLTGKPYVFSEGPMGDALAASSAIPWLKKPMKLHGRLLSDGLLSSNLPVAQARDMGADLVICVDLDGPIKTVSPEELRHIGSMENRTAVILMSQLDAQYLKGADVVLHPDVSDIGVLSHKLSDADKAIAQGEKAARQALGQIRQMLNRQNSQSAQKPAAK